MNVEAISVFVQVDGKTCIAPLNPVMLEMFVGMLAGFQRDSSKGTTLIALPSHIAASVHETGRLIGEYQEGKR